MSPGRLRRGLGLLSRKCGCGRDGERLRNLSGEERTLYYAKGIIISCSANLKWQIEDLKSVPFACRFAGPALRICALSLAATQLLNNSSLASVFAQGMLWRELPQQFLLEFG